MQTTFTILVRKKKKREGGESVSASRSHRKRLHWRVARLIGRRAYEVPAIRIGVMRRHLLRDRDDTSRSRILGRAGDGCPRSGADLAFEVH